jgi:pimeloyl-ACP methyl ester carboxylesterase
MKGRLRGFAALAGGALLVASLAGCGGGAHATSSTVPTTAPGAASAKSTSSTAAATQTGAGLSAVTPVHWVSCHGAAGPSGYQCATVLVPRDPKNPSLGFIGLAIDRHRATGSAGERIGSLLVNPGGPGESGVDALPGIVSGMPKDVLARFDVVGFDPPGVGRSAPITCLDSAGLSRYFDENPAPTTTLGFDALLAEARTFVAGCQQRSGTELPYVSTVDAAMDMDLLRQALGDQKLSYFGLSYGTSLGATYAQLYPTRVRVMVLDGALDPSVPALTQINEQSAGLERQLHQFISTCTSDSACPWKPGPDPEGSLDALLGRSETSRLPARGTSRTVGPAEVLYGTLWPLYFTSTWPALANTLATASSGDGTDLLEEFDSYTGRDPNGSYANIFEANAAVNCLDQPPPTIAQIRAAVPAAEAASPFFGLADLYGEVECSVWPVPATGQVGPVHAVGSPPIVVVGSTGDPITLYSWAQSLATQLQHGVLLTRVGAGHTGYYASSCIRAHVDSYLITGVPPAAGTSCSSD